VPPLFSPTIAKEEKEANDIESYTQIETENTNILFFLFSLSILNVVDRKKHITKIKANSIQTLTKKQKFDMLDI